MSHLFLHIGMNKTGSTSIQRTLQANSKILAENGFNYFDHTANHTFLLQYLFRQNKHQIRLVQAKGLTSLQEIDRYYAKDLALFESFLEKHKNNNVILSGEGISRLTASEVEALKVWFAKRFKTIDVIVYLRPPRSAITSMAQQRVKGGLRFSDIFNTFERTNILPYREVIEPWLKTFGPNNLQVGLFSKNNLKAGDVLTDFLDRIGLGSGQLALKVMRLNESFSLPAVKLLSTLNEEYYRQGHRFGLMTRYSAQLRAIRGDKFSLPRAFLDDQIAAHRNDIDWVRDTLGIDLEADDSSTGNVTRDSLRQFTPEEMLEICRVLGPDWLFDPVDREKAAP